MYKTISFITLFGACFLKLKTPKTQQSKTVERKQVFGIILHVHATMNFKTER